MHPEVYKTHSAFLKACASSSDAELLELCRARMAQTLSCREELARHSADLLAEIESREQSSLSDLQRNALAFVDQFLLDPSLIGPELVAELESELGVSGVIDFTTVISAYEASLRLSTLLDLEPTK